MSIVYLNGRFLPEDQALVSVLDRGFVFGDGVYEVIPVYWGQPFRIAQHLERLNSSLSAIRMQDPLTAGQWSELLANLLRFNPAPGDQSVYLQITRGPAKRDHAIPQHTKLTLFAMCNPITPPDSTLLTQGVSVVTLEDIRWQYCHIKAITLLPNVLLRANASDHGALDAILLRDGQVTEGTASNVFVWTGGVLCTPPKSRYLLPGITRDLVLEIAQQHGVNATELNLTEVDLQAADEIWLTSSTKEILPVTQLNGRPVGAGVPGEHWRAMLAWYQEYKRNLRAGVAS
ncbi:MAG: D-amino acid aminotransferase [Gammaproteobacteria bacterium]|nr:D-amino acid aminotransferase [Gammaproteobacteria bacterium]